MINNMPNVKVLMARCSSTGESFGVRLEEVTPGAWLADWAFHIKDAQARKEGYHENVVTGEFGFASKYPGCPHCGRDSLVRCRCEEITCWDGDSRNVSCPSCGRKGKIGTPVTKLKTDIDR